MQDILVQNKEKINRKEKESIRGKIEYFQEKFKQEEKTRKEETELEI